MAHAVRNFDEEKVKDCKEDIDTLLVFVRYSRCLEHIFPTDQALLGRSLFRGAHGLLGRVV